MISVFYEENVSFAEIFSCICSLHAMSKGFPIAHEMLSVEGFASIISVAIAAA